MATEHKPGIIRQLSPKKVIWPILIGLAVVIFLFWRSFDLEAFRQINWTITTFYFIGLGALAMVLRDISYTYRLRLLTNKRLTWKRCLQVVWLWEFGSAATPSSVGGSTLTIFILSKEGISAGRSTAIVMFAILLDLLVFVLVIPVFLFFYRQLGLFPDASILGDTTGAGIMGGLLIYFLFSFGFIFIYCLLLAYGLFINPLGVKKLLYRAFSLRILRKWRKGALKAGTDMIIASHEIRGRHYFFWIKAFLATLAAWTGRFLVANMLLLAFYKGYIDQVLMLGRQAIMYVILMGSPTPGGSGVAELSFTTFLAEYVPDGLEATLSLLWRILSYYTYLAIGVILLPRWVKRVFAKKPLKDG